MAVISVRDLQRDAKAVFDAVAENGEPQVITRRGVPVAALIPIGPEDAETMLLAGSRDLLRDAREAENARAEGRTVSLESALGEIAEGGEPDFAGASEMSDRAELLSTSTAVEDMRPFVGAALLPLISSSIIRRASEVTSRTLKRAAERHVVDGADSVKYVARILDLSAQLISLEVRRELLSTAQDRLASISAGTALPTVNAEHLIESELADDMVGYVASELVKKNEMFVDASLGVPESEFVKRFEAKLHGSIEALEPRRAR